MIFDDYRNGIRNRLIEDSAYFTQSTPIEILPQRQRGLRKAVQDAVATRGIVGVIGRLRLVQDDRLTKNGFIIESDIEFFENQKLTEEADDGRDGEACVFQAGALLGGFEIPTEIEGAFDPFKILFCGFSGERDGQLVHRLTIRTLIYIDNIASVLADQAGAWLVDENGNPLLVTP